MSKKVGCITINTDASFCTTEKVGGYAFYIVCNYFKIQKGGMFTSPVKTSQAAETMCIGNAVATLLAQKELPECNLLIINTDCLTAIAYIEDGKTQEGKITRDLLRQLAKRVKAQRVEYRHVRAHSNKTDARSYVNEWCDMEAKKWMRQKRDSLTVKVKK